MTKPRFAVVKRLRTDTSPQIIEIALAHAVSYVRFSSPKQALGDSLRRQLERTRGYCSQHGLTLDETLRDDGLSGYTGDHVKHGALGRFLAAVEGGRVPRGTYLIIEHLDRFSRQNTRIALTLLLNLINSGIRVVTLFNEQVYSDRSETIEHDLIGAILYMSEAHKASERKADLLKQTWEGKRKGLSTGQRKVFTHTRPAWLDVGSDGRFIPNRQGAATVRRVFELVAAGMSTHAVCQLFNESRVPILTRQRKDGTPIGKGWNTARVSQIIKSDAVRGWFQPHRRNGDKRVPIGEPIKDYFPLIGVSQELVDRSRYQISTRKFHGKGSGNSGACVTNLFTGLAKCGVCGAQMYLYSHGNGRRGRQGFHGFLRCSDYKRNMECNNAASIPYAAFERFIVRLIGGFSIPEGEAGTDKVTQALVERLAEAKAEATKTQEAVTMLVNAFVGGAGHLVMARISQLEAEHVKLTADVADLEKQIATERGKSTPSDEIEAIRRILADVQSSKPDVKLLARTRVAAGMKQFIRHFLCFPNRGVIAEYDLGSRDSVMCIIRCWLRPDGEYEVYHTDWDWGQRKGKAWLSFARRQLHRTDGDQTTPVTDWQNHIRDYDRSRRTWNETGAPWAEPQPSAWITN